MHNETTCAVYFQVFNLLEAKCLLEYGTVNIPYSCLENEIPFSQHKVNELYGKIRWLPEFRNDRTQLI